MIIQVFSAFWAVAMFSILTETPKKFLPYAAFPADLPGGHI